MAFTQQELGTCDLVDLLEEASDRKRPVTVALANGDSFSDVVQDVVTENHEDWVVFQQHGRHRVKDVLSCTRAETTADIPLESPWH